MIDVHAKLLQKLTALADSPDWPYFTGLGMEKTKGVEREVLQLL